MPTRSALERSFQLMSRLSLRGMYRLGDIATFAISKTPNQVSRQVRANIRLCFGDLDRDARARLYRESIRHTCYAMAELPAIWHWPSERLVELIDASGVCAEFQASENSRLVIAPHLGSWEMLAQWLGINCDAMFLYKKRKNPAQDRYVLESRARSGGVPVSTKKRGLRQLLLGMQRNKTVMILPDQKPSRRKHRIDARFFGLDAPTMPLVQMLCAKVECDVFIAAMCRSEPAGRFELVIRPLSRTRLVEADGAQYMNDAIEALVREYLVQYQWGYQRFASALYASPDKGHA